MKKYLLSVILVAALLGGLEVAQATVVVSHNTKQHTLNFLKTHNWFVSASSKISIIPRTKSGLEQHCQYPDQSSCYESGCTENLGHSCQECTDDSYECIEDW